MTSENAVMDIAYKHAIDVGYPEFMNYCSSTNILQKACNDNQFWYKIYKYEMDKWNRINKEKKQDIGAYDESKSWEDMYLNDFIWTQGNFLKDVYSIILMEGTNFFDNKVPKVMEMSLEDFFDFTVLEDARTKPNGQNVYFVEVENFNEWWIINSIIKHEMVQDESFTYYIFVIEMFKTKEEAIERFADCFVDNLDLSKQF